MGGWVGGWVGGWMDGWRKVGEGGKEEKGGGWVVVNVGEGMKEE